MRCLRERDACADSAYQRYLPERHAYMLLTLSSHMVTYLVDLYYVIESC